MASVKVTFTLDQATIVRLQDAAARLSLPKSEVVREAIAEFHDRIGNLSERERQRMLRTFDDMVSRIPRRPQREVEQELRAIRVTRSQGGRKSMIAAGRS